MRLGYLSLALLLTACNQVSPIQPIPSAPAGSPAAGAGAATPASPAVGPTQAPATQAPPAGATPMPQVSAPPPGGGGSVVVGGMVYDEAGAPLSDAMVEVRSLNDAVPYAATAKTTAGSWVVNNVPEGVNVAVRVTKDGHTSRTRVTAFQRNTTQRNELNFGGASTDAGAAYFLSAYPEVAATEPITKATDRDPATLTYKLVLSEALDDVNRKRFEEALRVFPADELASPDGVGTNHTDLEGVADTPAINVDASYHYAIKKGTIFLADTATAATIAWSADNKEATLSFKAPLIAGRNGQAKYQVGLVRGPGSEPRILDRDGKQLGTDEAGSLTAYPATAGDLIRNVFKQPDLAGTTATTPAARWAATHDSTTSFAVRSDEIVPKLMGVAVRTVGNDTRFELAFSEPMAAYDGTTGGYVHAKLADLASYHFAVATTAAKLADLKLTGSLGGSAPVADPVADATFGDLDADRELEFKLTGAHADGDRADVGDVYVTPDPRDATHVWITIVGRKGWLDPRLGAIKARVEAVGDPAGNAISGSAADRDQVTGTL